MLKHLDKIYLKLGKLGFTGVLYISDNLNKLIWVSLYIKIFIIKHKEQELLGTWNPLVFRIIPNLMLKDKIQGKWTFKMKARAVIKTKRVVIIPGMRGKRSEIIVMQ